jgi:hypothetical protein
MERLHHWNTRFATRYENRRRNHQPRVMDVDDIRLLRAQQFGKFSSRIVIPDRFLYQH